MADELWTRQPGETKTAYAAFCEYRNMHIHERSIDAAYRRAKGLQEGSEKRAHSTWFKWSRENNWVARVAEYDDYLSEQDRLIWERRRAEVRQRDWEEAERLRNIVSDAIPSARQFIHSRRTFIEGEDGELDREIITMTFDITGLTKVLVDASKLQRLATDEPTDNITLSGAALDAAIARELARLADGSETGDAETPAEDGSTGDEMAADGEETLP
jgi:hypothetical protein